MAATRTIKRDTSGRFATTGKQTAIRMPKGIRRSTTPHRSQRAIRSTTKKG